MDSSRRRAWQALGALGASAWAGVAAAQTALEGGPLKIVVPYPPGGSSDRAARLVSDAIAPRLGVPVIVENRVGAGGRLAAQQLHRDTSGHNQVLLANPATMVVAPLVFKDNGYDPERDYQPLAQVTRYAFGVAVGAGVPVREFSHLRAWMQVNQAQIAAGVPATGSLPHFFVLMLGEQLGLKMPVVGYRGSAPLLNDLMGGHVPIAVDTLDSLEPLHKAGKLRILAVSSERRTASLPTVPTFRDVGLKLSAEGWNVLYAPSSLPAARAQRIAQAVAEAMADKALQARFVAADMEPVSSGPEATRRMLTAFQAQWAPVVRQSGFQP
ncbi:tripartite tricarboxylate transporter substrate-binding protein [Curvibacter sp. RS43]|uniref:Tripartite tricarboxylate transporter substrate-binding protein n=1 Tax=Curvibacter microcysteis TaxID=3026419 RepID=A0ABT5M9R2_9BURK|nr:MULTISPECIES: tripartite tricarboxylate transporter substrate-binding protein [unclassified Curvibacter]MDD0812166.1 tripartite tricarboxylate transporter substrate-binding protein [Curvibacter sp. RS43]MDD0813130.1 tripartite tricarboxylate transporter substrate-binding protein [Curvibacter sp. HBC28]